MSVTSVAISEVKNIQAQTPRRGLVFRDVMGDALEKRVDLPMDKNGDFFVPTEYKTSRPAKEIIVLQLVAKACNGDDGSIASIIDRIDGKAVQRSENLGINMTYKDFLEQSALSLSQELDDL